MIVDALENVSVMDKLARIRKHPDKKEWTVYSEKGKKMGTYPSESAAKNRLRQIEYFKHSKIYKADDTIDPNFHGDPPDFLKVEVKEKKLSSENSMKNNLYKLAQKLKSIDEDSAAEEIKDLADTIQTSTSKTPFVKDLMPAEDFEGMGGDSSLEGLTVMLAYLRAMQAWFHGAHHVTGGEGFSGDHTELYTKIYEAIIEDYDAAAEKAVGLSGESAACPIMVMDNANKIISKFKSPCDLSAVEIARHGYNIIMKYLDFLEMLYDSFEKNDSLTLGLDDFIMSMANSYETFAYLLKQRSSDYRSGDKRSKI